jgi:glycosyltransferase involved in cell wall biosynthesis
MSEERNLSLNNAPLIDVEIPAFNEENAVGQVIDDLPKHLLRHIVVCDNGSSDNTAQQVLDRNAIVVYEARKGYGSACLKALSYIRDSEPLPAIIVFLDADYSDKGEELIDLVQPIIEDQYEMVIGSRVLGQGEKGALTQPQRYGNALATFLIRLIYGVRYTDLGPFRAITFSALEKLEMSDPDYGWTVEMQIKAARQKLKLKEVPVSYRKRIGHSKVSGTLKGVFMAGYKILGLIFWYALMKKKR